MTPREHAQRIVDEWHAGHRADGDDVQLALSFLDLASKLGVDQVGQLSPQDLHHLYDGDFWEVLRPVSEEEVANAPTFSQSYPQQMDRHLHEVFAWRARVKAFERKTGKKWRPQYQQRGTCVGQGGKLAADDLMALAWALHGVEFPGAAAVAGMYPGSRVDVGGQPGRWDGSTGSWLNTWVTQRGGILLLNAIGLPEDSRNEDEQMAVRWCASREGVPAEYEDDAKVRVVAVGVRCSTTEELTVGLNSEGVLVQCSNLIATGRRDANGYSPLKRSGGHCQLVDGCRGIQGRDAEGFWEQNSWSEQWGSGGKYVDDQPDGGVWIHRSEMQAQLDQRDSYMWFGVNGPSNPDSEISL